MSAGPTGKWLVLEVSKATAYAGEPVQVSLAVLDADGSGGGTRLAGPKFSGSGSVLLRSTELDERARQDIRRSLDEVDGRTPFTPCEHGNKYGECVLVFGHEKLRSGAVGGPGFTAPNHIDRFGNSWNVGAGS